MVAPDPQFDRFARLVQDALGTPVALVTLVEADRQVFPGMTGLSEPWAAARETPLSHSFCQYVVADEAPLVIADARVDDRLAGNGAIADLGVVAYAGFPLRDAAGATIGSVCAIDSQPRQWSERELRMLADIADLCSTELELRAARDELGRTAKSAGELSARAQLLLSLSERLAETITTSDIAAALQDVAAKNLDCNHAGIWLLDPAHHDLRFVPHPSLRWPQAEQWPVFAGDTGNPIGAPFIRRQPFFYRDRAGMDADFPALVSPPQPGDGQARALLPLAVGDQMLGTLVLLWPQDRDFTNDDRVLIAALTSYTSQAVARAVLLAERAGAAATLQHALLTELPQPDDLELAARYRTAERNDEVGGDWYDAIVLPSGATNLVIGDVVGHDMRAAATMGSLRSLLRAFAWAIDDTPSANVRRLDRATGDLGVRALASLVFGRIEQTPEQRARGIRLLRWTNAGHPPPLLVSADGTCRFLDDGAPADLLLGVDPAKPRRDQTVEIEPGATLLLYTDGLVETRSASVDAGLARLLDAAVRHHARPAPAFLDAVLADLLGGVVEDDAAVLAVRFHPQD